MFQSVQEQDNTTSRRAPRELPIQKIPQAEDFCCTKFQIQVQRHGHLLREVSGILWPWYTLNGEISWSGLYWIMDAPWGSLEDWKGGKEGIKIRITAESLFAFIEKELLFLGFFCKGKMMDRCIYQYRTHNVEHLTTDWIPSNLLFSLLKF